MNNIQLHSLKGGITIKAIRDSILDFKLNENDSIILNSWNFDDIVIEYRETYQESISVPFFLLRILIKEDNEKIVPLNKIGIIRNDVYRSEYDYNNQASPNENYKYEHIYRCGFCGNIVDYDGSEFDGETRQFKINIFEKYKDTITVTHVYGNCCPQH